LPIVPPHISVQAVPLYTWSMPFGTQSVQYITKPVAIVVAGAIGIASRWVDDNRGGKKPWFVLYSSSKALASGLVVPIPTLFWALTVNVVNMPSKAMQIR
jgi:hypothetical protein